MPRLVQQSKLAEPVSCPAWNQSDRFLGQIISTPSPWAAVCILVVMFKGVAVLREERRRRRPLRPVKSLDYDFEGAASDYIFQDPNSMPLWNEAVLNVGPACRAGLCDLSRHSQHRTPLFANHFLCDSLNTEHCQLNTLPAAQSEPANLHADRVQSDSPEHRRTHRLMQ